MGQDVTLYQSKNRASGQLQSGIGASATTIVLKPGEGAEFPQPIKGSATSGGDSTTLNSTGIQAAGVAVGDFIKNITDNSYAVVTAVSTNQVTTTELAGGSGNTWDSSDEWVVKPFLLTLSTKDADGVITDFEIAEIIDRSTDTLTVSSDGRGFGGSSADTWSADDYAELFVNSEYNTELIKMVCDLAILVQNNTDTKADSTTVTDLLNQRNWKQAVVAATTAAGTLASDFEDGDTIDGVTLATGDRVLIKDQADASENGLYTVEASGAPTRATDMDENDEVLGAIVYVQQGTANADLLFQVTSDTDPFTLDSDNMVWAQFTAGLVGASQAEAEAGANNTKYMTPLRVAQAIEALQNISDANATDLTDSGETILHSHPLKAGLIQRDLGAAAGTVNTAHGLGKAPKLILFFHHTDQVAPGSENLGVGVWVTGGTNKGIGDTGTLMEDLGSDVISTYESAGNGQEADVSAVDATNFTLNWTKSGTPSSYLVNIIWVAFG